VVARIEGFEYLERVATKPVHVVGIPEAELRSVIKFFDDPRRTTEVENSIAELLEVGHGDVVLGARQFFDRLAPQDVPLYSQSRRQLISLFEREPHHHKSLQDQFLGLFALRVAVPEEKRAFAASKGREIIDLLFKEMPDPENSDSGAAG
jgi:hypothetical protein